MSQDPRSADRRHERTATPLQRRDEAPSIGFHELRQACEISTLREDLERIVLETQGLRDEIEESVSQVRARFLALSEEDLLRPEAMAPLLEFAVTTMLELRERSRRIDLSSGPLPDDDRPGRPATLDPARADRLQHGSTPSDAAADMSPVGIPASAAAILNGQAPASPLDDAPDRGPQPDREPQIAEHLTPRPLPPRGQRPPPVVPVDDSFWLQSADGTASPNLSNGAPSAPAPAFTAPPVIPATVGTVLSEQALRRARQQPVSPSLDPLAPAEPRPDFPPPLASASLNGGRQPAINAKAASTTPATPPPSANFLAQAAPMKPAEEKSVGEARSVDWLGPARR